MSARMAEARKEAFLRALEETGNVTLAAEAAKVSRSWVRLHRTDNAGFDAEVRAAAAAARERLAAHAERRPPSGWGFLDGEELVVKGSRGRRVQIARARLKQWTPRIEDRFLAALAATCNVKAAVAEVGMTAPSAYAHRKRWRAFARRWDAAVESGYAALETALLEAGCNLFSAAGQPAPAAITGMTAEQAIHLLHMHKHQVHAIGRAPGGPQLRVTEGELARTLTSLMDALERKRRADPKARARAERDYAARRPSPATPPPCSAWSPSPRDLGKE